MSLGSSDSRFYALLADCATLLLLFPKSQYLSRVLFVSVKVRSQLARIVLSSPSEATSQSRYDVLWRTHHHDLEHGSHPASGRCGSKDTASFKITIWRQFRIVVRHDMRMLLGSLTQVPDDAPYNPFLA